MQQTRSAMALAPLAATLAMTPVLVSACESAATASKYEFPATSGSAIYVAANATEAGDGTKDKPFKTVGEAAAKAKAGTTIALAPGKYTESVTVAGGVNVVGTGSGKVTIAPPAEAHGIALQGTGVTSKIEGLTISEATLLGVSSKGVGLDMKDVTVSGTKGSATLYGHGVQVTDATAFNASGCQIKDNSGVGVYLVSVGKVSIIAPTYSPSPVGAEGSTAIIDPTYSPGSSVTGNKQGGIAIIDPTYSPQSGGAAVEGGATISATNIGGNSMFGIAISGGPLKLVRSAVHGTKKPDNGNTDVADGVVVFETSDKKPASVEVDAATVVGGNIRAGLVVASGGEVAVAGRVRENGRGGVWAAGEGTSVRLVQSARLERNALVGAGVAKGAKLEVIGARIEGTQAYPQPQIAGGTEVIGDAIGMFKGARVSVKDAQLRDSARAAIVVREGGAKADGGLDLNIAGTTISGAKVGVAVVGGFGAKFADAGLKSGGNKVEKVDKEVDPASPYKVQTNVCGAGDDSNASCLTIAKRKD